MNNMIFFFKAEQVGSDASAKTVPYTGGMTSAMIFCFQLIFYMKVFNEILKEILKEIN